jgi:hypothetical protein
MPPCSSRAFSIEKSMPGSGCSISPTRQLTDTPE